MSQSLATTELRCGWVPPSPSEVTAYESRMDALKEIDQAIGRKLVESGEKSREVQILYARRHVVEIDVKDLRRRVTRINWLSQGGEGMPPFRIFEMEVAD